VPPLVALECTRLKSLGEPKTFAKAATWNLFKKISSLARAVHSI
jgi:hypothetical protein